MATPPPALHRRLCQLTLLAAAPFVLGGCGERAMSGTMPEVRTVETVTAPGELPQHVHEVAGHLEQAGCVLEAPPVLEPMHVESLDGIEFTSDPPTSGPHFENWAWFGFYRQPVHDGYVLHNLEHGGVALWYGQDVSQHKLRVLRDDVLDDLEKWLVTPRQGVDGISSAAWGVLLHCDAATLKAMQPAAFGELMDRWYAAAESRGSETEGQLRPIPPLGDAGSFDPPLPQPERDISERPLY